VGEGERDGPAGAYLKEPWLINDEDSHLQWKVRSA